MKTVEETKDWLYNLTCAPACWQGNSETIEFIAKCIVIGQTIQEAHKSNPDMDYRGLGEVTWNAVEEVHLMPEEDTDDTSY